MFITIRINDCFSFGNIPKRSLGELDNKFGLPIGLGKP